MGTKTIPETLKAKADMIRSEQADREAFEDRYRDKAREELSLIPEDFTESDVTLLAENAMMRDGFIPSSMTGWLKCKRCGSMPADFGFNGDTVEGCPWCHTPWGQKFIDRTRAEVKHFEEQGTHELQQFKQRNPEIAKRWEEEDVLSFDNA